METAIFFFRYDNHEYFCDTFVRFALPNIFDSGISNNINEQYKRIARSSDSRVIINGESRRARRLSMI